MEFIEIVRNLCNERGTSVKQLEKDLGFSNGSLAKGVPRADRLHKIAEHFDVPMEYFFDLDYFEKTAEQFKRYLEQHEKPLYRTAAGEGAYNDTYTSDSITMGEEGYEYATVVGDSMLPELRDGDVLKIEPTSQTSPKDYTLIKVDGEDVTVKFVEVVDNGIWVRALNKEVYADRFYSIQDVLTLPITIIGKAVAFRRAL